MHVQHCSVYSESDEPSKYWTDTNHSTHGTVMISAMGSEFHAAKDAINPVITNNANAYLHNA